MIIVPRFHQHLVVNKCVEAVVEDAPSEVLLACICRSGKTFMVAGIVEELAATDHFGRGSEEQLRVLIITSRPTETRDQWRDVFAAHSALAPTIISRQKGGIDAKDLAASMAEYDIVIFDEAHEGGATELSRNLLNSVKRKDRRSLFIFVTATYNKLSVDFHISEKSTFLWSYEDNERVCRGEWGALANLHGSRHVHNALLHCGVEGSAAASLINESPPRPDSCMHIQNHYHNLPKLELFFLNVDFPREQWTSDVGFGFPSLFALNDGGGFQNDRQVRMFFEFFMGSNPLVVNRCACLLAAYFNPVFIVVY